jgi:hypothetical protein
MVFGCGVAGRDVLLCDHLGLTGARSISELAVMTDEVVLLSPLLLQILGMRVYTQYQS